MPADIAFCCGAPAWRLRRRPCAALLATAASGLLLGACGSVPLQDRQITFRGAINANYAPGPPGSCGPGATLVTGLVGPDRQKDYADMTVSDGGGVVVDAPQLGGTFSGSGVTFRAGQGWDLDAVVKSPSGQSIHVAGHLGC